MIKLSDADRRALRGYFEIIDTEESCALRDRVFAALDTAPAVHRAQVHHAPVHGDRCGRPCALGHKLCDRHGGPTSPAMMDETLWSCDVTVPATRLSNAGTPAEREWNAHEKYMIYSRGFRDGAGIKAMAKEFDGLPWYERGYRDGGEARRKAVAAFAAEVGYIPNILRLEQEEPK